MAYDWFGFLCLHLGCSVSFAKGAKTQLAKQFRNDVGFGISSKGLYLAPPDQEREHGGVWIDDDGVGHVRTELLGSTMEITFEVGFAWRCEGSETGIPVVDEIQSGCRLLVWWEILPVQEIQRTFDQPVGPPWPTSPTFPYDPGRYRFDVQWEPISLPDLFIEIETDGPLEMDRRDELMKGLWHARERWNDVAPASGRGIIHDFGDAQFHQISGNRFEVAVDFGSADPGAIVVLLDALRGSESGTVIQRVVIRGHAMAGMKDEN
jgi:hypothetical protein